MDMTDSHNHIHFKEFEADLALVMERAAAVGVKTMLAVGTDPDDSARAVAAAGKLQGVYAAVGIHPQLAHIYRPEDVNRLEGIVTDRVVAVGETGFDLYRAAGSASEQEKIFIAHMGLARRLNLPIVIHDREAHDLTVAILDRAGGWESGGVFHCFSGDVDLAWTVVNRGFLVSIPGVITYRRAQTLRDVVRAIPMEAILVETDAPYLAPEPSRGRRNEPSFMVRTVEEIARIKGLDPEHVAGAASDNFRRLFLGGRDI
jgi:TatD DNase family protein